jgi:hypothetical protein
MFVLRSPMPPSLSRTANHSRKLPSANADRIRRPSVSSRFRASTNMGTFAGGGPCLDRDVDHGSRNSPERRE